MSTKPNGEVPTPRFAMWEPVYRSSTDRRPLYVVGIRAVYECGRTTFRYELALTRSAPSTGGPSTSTADEGDLLGAESWRDRRVAQLQAEAEEVGCRVVPAP